MYDKEKNHNQYTDIIHMQHHMSLTHPHMDISDRAAQFSPFAALTGYESAIKETGRSTSQRRELGEDRKELLDRTLQALLMRLDERPEVVITFFAPDSRKAGGEYVTISGTVKSLNEYENVLVMENGRRIPLDAIADMKFSDMDSPGFLTGRPGEVTGV